MYDQPAASGTEGSDRAADSDSDEGEDPKADLDPFLSTSQTDETKCEPELCISIEKFVAYLLKRRHMYWCDVFDLPGTGWVADFGEVNSKAPAAGAGFSAWNIPDTQPSTTEAGEKGWAKFTDFQPFCW